MRRFLRWALNFTAVVSAVLFVATTAAWLASYWDAEGTSYVRGSRAIRRDVGFYFISKLGALEVRTSTRLRASTLCFEEASILAGVAHVAIPITAGTSLRLPRRFTGVLGSILSHLPSKMAGEITSSMKRQRLIGHCVPSGPCCPQPFCSSAGGGFAASESDSAAPAATTSEPHLIVARNAGRFRRRRGRHEAAFPMGVQPRGGTGCSSNTFVCDGFHSSCLPVRCRAVGPQQVG